MEALEANDTDILKRCLRIYATVDRIEDAETLLKNKIVEPQLDEIINSDNLHSEPMGLQGICQKILKIIPTRLQLLLKLSRSNRKQENHYDFIGKKHALNKYDRFTLNTSSFWGSTELNITQLFFIIKIMNKLIYYYC